MNRNKRRRTPVLPMLMLLAALGMGTAGCSQSDDDLLPTTQQQGTPAARGDEPLLLSIGAKPGFEGGSTRADVDDASGAWTWVAGDKVYVKLTFKNAENHVSIVHHRLEYKGSATTGYAKEWEVYKDWKSTDLSPITAWKEGSVSCLVQAFYTDSGVTVDENTNTPTIALTYATGTGDHLLFSKEFSLGEDLKVELKHVNTRLTFKGLNANATYRLIVANSNAPVMGFFKATDFALSGETTKTDFATDGGGSFTFCLPLDAKLPAGAGRVTVAIVESSTNTTVGTIGLQGTKIGTVDAPVYSLAGQRFNISVVANGGGVHPGNNPDLLP